MDYINAIILGIVEGVTEFLPISSTGHLILVNQFIGFTGKFANMFDVVIQLGAILSVVVLYWHKLIPFGNSKNFWEKQEIWELWKKTIVGVFPALFFGALFADFVEEKLFNPITVSIALLVGGLILIILESRKQFPTIKTVSQLSYKTAFFIGMIQCLAMIPGTSRSAATIIAAMIFGASRSVAAEFSFFLAIPTMVAASAYTLLKSGAMMSGTEWMALGVGFFVSFIVAWLVIAALMRYIQKRDFKLFGYYRILLGAAILVFSVLR